MNKIIIMISTLLLNNLVFAKDDWCELFAALSESIMVSRQLGVPIEKVIAINDKYPKDVKESANRIVIAAYKSPLFNSETAKKQAIAEFKNDAYLTCFENNLK